MTVIEHSSLHLASTTRPSLALRVLRVINELRRIRANRADMRRLCTLSDWQLNDIGLTRGDLHTAYDGPIMHDPTRTLGTIMQKRLRLEDTARRIC